MGQSPCKSWVISLYSAVTVKDEDEDELIFPFKHRSMKYSHFLQKILGKRLPDFFMYKRSFKMFNLFTQRKLFDPGRGETSLSF